MLLICATWSVQSMTLGVGDISATFGLRKGASCVEAQPKTGDSKQRSSFNFSRTGKFYAYSQLRGTKHTRLIKLHPSVSNQRLVCSLIPVLLGEVEGTYTAISYAWGQRRRRVSITCDGKVLKITQNLHDALLYLRLGEQDHLIWCDAICINQRDKVEKASQLPMMGTIYEKAAKVAIWLGRDEGLAATAFEMIQEITKAVFAQKSINDVAEIRELESLGTLVYGIEPGLFSHYNSNDWNALIRLFRRPWFQRVWVIQEVATNRQVDVVCGKKQIEWVVLALVATWLEDNDHYFSTQLPTVNLRGVYNAAFMYDKTQYHDRAWPKLLDRGRSFQASDPRDKIYGLIGHPSVKFGVDDGTRELFPEYSKSKTVTEIYAEVTRRHIDQSGTLDILSQVDHGEGVRHSEFPSWVPRWDRQTWPNTLVLNDSLYLNASGELQRAGLNVCNTSRSLELPGLLLGSVKSVSAAGQIDTLCINASSPVANPVVVYWHNYASRLTHGQTSNSVETAIALAVTTGGACSSLGSADSRMMADFSAYMLPLISRTMHLTAPNRRSEVMTAFDRLKKRLSAVSRKDLRKLC